MKLRYYIFLMFLALSTDGVKADLKHELGKFNSSLHSLSVRIETTEIPHKEPEKESEKEKLQKLSSSITILKNNQKIENLGSFITNLEEYINFLIQEKKQETLVNDFSNEHVKKFFETVLDASDFHSLMQDLGLEESE